MSVSTEGNERDNQAIEENGTGCEGTEYHKLFKELRQLHVDNLRRIDDEVGRDGTEIKLEAMQSWISDLEEHNALLLQRMVQLEQEVGDRGSLLQEGLHRSSRAALAYRTRLDDYDKYDCVESNKDIQVASKHNEIGAVRQENQDLEAKCRELESMVCLKDDIILQLRKELIAAKFKENNNMDTAEHLKNLLLISDNTITDQDAMINYFRKTVRTSQTEVEMLKEKCEKYERSAEAVQKERENLKTEMEKLKNNLMSREKVAANQEEIINILQDSVNIAQKEQQDLQQKLKDAEAGKEKLLNTLQEERKKAENLQEALMVTKQQLEDLQGNKYEVSVNSGMSWGWSHTSRSGRVNKRTVHDV